MDSEVFDLGDTMPSHFVRIGLLLHSESSIREHKVNVERGVGV